MPGGKNAKNTVHPMNEGKNKNTNVQVAVTESSADDTLLIQISNPNLQGASNPAYISESSELAISVSALHNSSQGDVTSSHGDGGGGAGSRRSSCHSSSSSLALPSDARATPTGSLAQSSLGSLGKGTIGKPASKKPPPLILPGSVPIHHRRGSYQPITAQNSLLVPTQGPRRHSLTSSTQLFNHDDRFTGINVDGSVDSNVVDDSKPMQTINIDFLSMPKSPLLSPMSPGRWSVHSSTWREIDQLDKRRGSVASAHSETESVKGGDGLDASHITTSGNTMMSQEMNARLHNLVKRFNSRTEHHKERTIQPPTPSTTDSVASKSAISGDSSRVEPANRTRRLDSFIPGNSGGEEEIKKKEHFISLGRFKLKYPSFLHKIPNPIGPIDPQNKLYLFWLFIVSIAFTYNAVCMTLRGMFREARIYLDEEEIARRNLGFTQNCTKMYHNNGTNSTACETVPVERPVLDIYPPCETSENRIYWWILDYTADLIYVLDMLWVKPRIVFVKNGLSEINRKEMAMNYVRKSEFRYDLGSLAPFDILYLIPQMHFNALLRFPRLVKINVFWEFFDRMDQAARSGYMIRIVRTVIYMIFLIHLETCGYYWVSAYEGLRLNEWTYDGRGVAYIRCIYLATKTATSIGNNPKPVNELEYFFMTVYWLSGVFVFAMLIGQIRDIFQSAGAAKTQYRNTTDQTMSYMNTLNLPQPLQKRVRMWFAYNWEHQKTLNENSLLEALPLKMKADLAIHVHYQTLSKVQLFQDCDKNLLFDLVLKLQPILYLPRDYICQKGEIGTEMYIVKQGQVEVVGGENDSIVFATLHEGSVFGEISLLALAGGNRRTASVKSKGYSNLFILSKEDFEEAMSMYPEAQKLLRKRAKRLLAKNAKKVKEATEKTDIEEESQEVIKRNETPKLLKTVIRVLSPNSHIHDYLNAKKQKSAIDGEVKTDGDVGIDSGEEDEVLVVEQTETDIEADQSTEPKGTPLRQHSNQSTRISQSVSSIPMTPMSNSTSTLNPHDHPMSSLSRAKETVVNMDPGVVSIERVASPELLITKLVMEATKQMEDNKLSSLSTTSISVQPRPKSRDLDSLRTNSQCSYRSEDLPADLRSMMSSPSASLVIHTPHPLKYPPSTAPESDVISVVSNPIQAQSAQHNKTTGSIRKPPGARKNNKVGVQNNAAAPPPKRTNQKAKANNQQHSRNVVSPIPKENTVICSAEIHQQEETPSALSAQSGIDNLAFESADQSRKKTV